MCMDITYSNATIVSRKKKFINIIVCHFILDIMQKRRSKLSLFLIEQDTDKKLIYWLFG